MQLYGKEIHKELNEYQKTRVTHHKKSSNLFVCEINWSNLEFGTEDV